MLAKWSFKTSDRIGKFPRVDCFFLFGENRKDFRDFLLLFTFLIIE